MLSFVMMTAFSMFAVFETYGRSQGAKGLLDWFKKRRTDARFVLVFIGMLFFIPGGLGGIINASGQMNQVIHNTIWVVGHFHITVGAPVILTYLQQCCFCYRILQAEKSIKLLTDSDYSSLILGHSAWVLCHLQCTEQVFAVHRDAFVPATAELKLQTNGSHIK